MPELHRSATVTAAALAGGDEHRPGRHRDRAGVHPQPDDHRAGGARPRRALRTAGSCSASAPGCSGSTRTGTTPGSASRSPHLRETVRNIRPSGRSLHRRRRIDARRRVRADADPRLPAAVPAAARTIPIYLAAMGPLMTRLAGEIGDGWISHELCSARVPARADPARPRGRHRRAGAGTAPTSTSSSRRCCSVDADPALARVAAPPVWSASTRRSAPTPTSSTSTASPRSSRPSSTRSGRAPARTTSPTPCRDRMVDALTLSGTPDEVGAPARGLRRARRHHQADPADARVGGGRHPAAQAQIIEMIASLRGA